MSKITLAIGELINTFTTLQPVLMCILIAVLFSFIIVSPVSTVAVGLAIGISGLAAGAAAVGVATTGVVLFLCTMKVNKIGVPIAILLGAMKMMMTNVIRYPIMLLPIGLSAACAGAAAGMIGIIGTKEAAGFGLVGLVGPIKAIEMLDGPVGLNIFLVALVFVIIPGVVGFILNFVFTKVLKLYSNDIYRFLAAEETKS